MNFDHAKTFVQQVLAPYMQEAQISLNQRVMLSQRSQEPQANTVLMISPHPDDETINGLLPLRLQQENGSLIYNFPFTFGSNSSRQDARKFELEAACAHLGFINVFDEMLEHAIARLKPNLLIFPHAHDKHATHIKTHEAVMAATSKCSYSGAVAMWEFWQQNAHMNMMVESSLDDCAKLVSALSAHTGEVSRNPYHLRLPYWMMDNSRRGAELLLGSTAPVGTLMLSTLYEVKFFKEGKIDSSKYEARLLSLDDDISLVVS